MGTVVLCHKWLRKQGKLDVQINVFWLKGKRNIIKIQELTLSKVQLVTQQRVRCPTNHWDQQEGFKGILKLYYSFLKFLAELRESCVLGMASGQHPSTVGFLWSNMGQTLQGGQLGLFPCANSVSTSFFTAFLVALLRDGAIPELINGKAIWFCKQTSRTKSFLDETP